MPRRSKSQDALPPKVVRALVQIGADLRLARHRRGWSLRVAAGRLFITVATLRRVEAGHSGVSIGVLAHTLFIYGMSDRLAYLAHPSFDVRALASERPRSPGSEPEDFDV